MAGSYREIDYRIRPAKHAERLMLCDAFRRLRFHRFDDYQYVGLGSVYFSDFRLVHRALGISTMISIEKHEEDSARFEWNKPFAGIQMMFGRTERRLPDVDFSRPTITWLDFDGPLNSAVVGDIRLVAHAASHGSVLVVTVNAQPRSINSQGADMLDQVRAELGAERVPSDVELTSLRGWGLADFYRRVADSELRDALANANAVRADAQLAYEQLFNFRYRDGAQMVTFGGVFFEAARYDEFESCGFSRQNFYCPAGEGFLVSSPKLTAREIDFIEQQLPLPQGAALELGPIPEADAREYVRLYRFLPAFFPVEVL